MLLQSRNKKMGLGREGGLCFFRRKTSIKGKEVEKRTACFEGFEKDIFYW